MTAEPAPMHNVPTDRFSFSITSLTFNDGSTLQLEPGCTLILTGPNNCGKSHSLREINAKILNPNPNPATANSTVLRSIETRSASTRSGFISWLRRNYPVITGTVVDGDGVQHENSEIFLTREHGSISLETIPSPLPANYLLQSSYLFVRHLDTSSRLNIANIAPSTAHNAWPGSYINFVKRDEELHRSISSLVRSAFGRDLIINWGGGGNVWFHVGIDPPKLPGEDRVSLRYLTELERQQRLDSEGDGIRSFVGMLLAAKVGAHPILVIDEPETFLHPPQARRIGAILAETAVSLRRQVILATHSSDIIQGAMDASQNVVVCRMVRDGDVNRVSVLSRADLQALWSKPLLRSSVAINGLFHSGVVVCEGDSDCRFYEALALRAEQASSRPLAPYFVHGGGKGAAATLAQTYKAVKVPTAVIADLDLLRRREEFFKLYQILGGDADAIDPLYTRIHATLNDRKPLMAPADFAARLEEVMRRVRDANTVTSVDRKAIQDSLQAAADWSEVKRYGLIKLKGEELTAGKELLLRCREVGLFLAPVGVLEGRWPEGPQHKADWIAKAIPKIAEEPAVFEEASKFVAGVCEYLGGRQATSAAQA